MDRASNSIKEINRLSKEMNRLFSKGMSNIYLKVTVETFSKLWLSGFKIFVTSSVFGELQLTHISLTVKTSCCNLKTRGLGAKLCVAFLFLLLWMELWRFKVQKSMHFVEKNINSKKNDMESKMKNPTNSFRETNLVLQLI